MLERFGAWTGQNQRLLLIVLCVALYAVWFTQVPLTDIDETRYAVSSRHMLASGQYLMPEFNGVPRYEKPILFYWVQGTAMRLFGGGETVSEVAARLPSAVFGLLLVLVVHGFLLHWLTISAGEDATARARARGAAFVGGLALATLPLVAFWTRLGVTDLLLTFCTTGAILALAHADLARRHARPERAHRMGRGLYIVAGACAGLACLTKGPIGLAVPGLVWLGYHLAQRTLRDEARRVGWMWVPAILAFLVTAVPWYVVSYVVLGDAFARSFFAEDNAGRLLGFDSKYLGQVLVFLPGAALLTFPYSAFLLRETVLPFSGAVAMRADPLLPALRRFAWAWLITPLAIFMFAKTNYPNYYQSLVGAVGVLMALHVLGRTAPERDASPDTEGHADQVERWSFGLGGGVLMLGVAGLLLSNRALLRPRDWQLSFASPGRELVLALLLLAGGALVAGGLYWLRQRHAEAHLRWVLLGWPVLMGLLVLGFMPMALRAWYLPGVEVGTYLRTQVPAETHTAVYLESFPEEMLYYARRQVRFYDADEAGTITRLIQQTVGGPMMVVTDAKGLSALQHRTPASVVHTFPHFVLVRLEATPDGEGYANHAPNPEPPDPARIRAGRVGAPQVESRPVLPPRLEAPDTRGPSYTGPDAPYRAPQPPLPPPSVPTPGGPPTRR